MIVSSHGLSVSRETEEKLRALEALLLKWNPAINLVSKSTLEHLWDRHIVDSAQIAKLGTLHGHWVDLGSGGGFPGLVVACLSAEVGGHQRITLVESDQRKAAFLRTAASSLDLEVGVVAKRIENVPNLQANTVSARALAALPQLMNYAALHLAQGGVCLFPKGESWRQEVDLARKDWHFDLVVHPSVTDAAGAILEVKALSHV